MLQIKHLTVTHLRDNRVLLHDFSFVLRPGDRAVLIGEEGNGKSTLLKLLHDPALVAGYAETAGEIVRGGLKTGYLAQALPPEELNRSVRDFCRGIPGFDVLSPSELSGAACPLGLSPAFFYETRAVGTLSGGERVKLQLAALLLARPDVLLLDEPSGDLDLSTLRWLEGFLLRCEKPVLYVSHDETLIERTANVVLHLELLRRKSLPRHTVARMPYRQYVSQRLATFAHQEQEARKERADYDRQLEKYRQIEQKVEYRQETVSRGDPHGGRLLKKKMKAVKSMGRRFEREHTAMTPLPEEEEAIGLRFDGGVRFPPGKTVVDFHLPALTAGVRLLAKNIFLPVQGPEKVGIVGPNGAGKTTLLRLLAKELTGRADLRAAYMPQDYGELLDGSRTPVEFLSSTGDRAERVKIRNFLGSMRYTADEMEHAARDLSGGQRAKLFFLKMIFSRANVLVLDEPTRNLSPLSGPVVRQALRSFGGAVLCVSHDRKFLAEVCDRLVELTPEGLRPAVLPEEKEER